MADNFKLGIEISADARLALAPLRKIQGEINDLKNRLRLLREGQDRGLIDPGSFLELQAALSRLNGAVDLSEAKITDATRAYGISDSALKKLALKYKEAAVGANEFASAQSAAAEGAVDAQAAAIAGSTAPAEPSDRPGIGAAAATSLRALEAASLLEVGRELTKRGRPTVKSLRDSLDITAFRDAQKEIARLQSAHRQLGQHSRATFTEMNRATISLILQTNELSRSADGVADAFFGIRNILGKSLAIGTGIVFSTRAAIDFESALAKVQKVVDFDTPKGFTEFRQGLLDLTKTAPSTAEELANVAAIGGQMGLAARELLPFAESITKIGAALDLTVEESATVIGQLRSNFGLAVQDVTDVAGTISLLGDAFNTNERNIANVVVRLGGTARGFGLTAQQAAGLATTLLEFGRAPEVAASALDALLQRLQGIRSDTPKAQEALQAVVGDLTDFGKLRLQDPMKALRTFFTGLRRFDDDSVGTILKEVVGQPFVADLSPIIQDLGILDRAIAVASDKKRAATRVEEEYKQKLKTTESQLKLLQSAVNRMGVELGTAFLPSVVSVAQALANVVQAVADFASQNQTFVAIKVAMVAVAGSATALRLVMASLGLVIGKTLGEFATSMRGIPGKVGEIRTAFKGLELAKGSVLGLGRSILGLLGPIGQILTAIGFVTLAWQIFATRAAAANRQIVDGAKAGRDALRESIKLFREQKLADASGGNPFAAHAAEANKGLQAALKNRAALIKELNESVFKTPVLSAIAENEKAIKRFLSSAKLAGRSFAEFKKDQEARGASEQERLKTFSFQSPGPDGGESGAAGDTAAKAAQDALAATRAASEAGLATVRDAIEAQKTLLEQKLQDNLISIRQFHAEKARLEAEGIDAEIEALQKELVLSSGNAAERIRVESDIEQARRKRAAVVAQSAREEGQAEAQLLESLKGIKNDLLQLKGQPLEAIKLELDDKFREDLQRIQAQLNDPGIQPELKVRLTAAVADVNEFKRLSVASAELDALQQRADSIFSVLEQRERSVQLKIDANLLTEVGGRREVVALHQATAQQLQALIPEYERLNQVIQTPESLNALLELKNRFEELSAPVNEWAQALESTLKENVTSLFQGMIDGTKKAGDAFDEFAKNVFKSIANLIAQRLGEQLVDSLFTSVKSSTSGGGKGGDSGFDIFSTLKDIAGFFFHSGGVVGAAGTRRQIPALAFADAPSYHTGGVLGLKPDEIPAVLQRGEEVLTARDPRHRDNLHTGNGGQRTVVENRTVNIQVSPDLMGMRIGDWLENYLAREAATR